MYDNFDFSNASKVRNEKKKRDYFFKDEDIE